MYKLLIKRLFDFVLSLVGLVAISPILLIVSLLLLTTNRDEGIFFLQSRPGKNGKLFKLIKFKTMNGKRYPTGKLLPDNERLTAIGKVIRTFSIDELPQLINVLKGEMSLVGPRPLLNSYLPLYSNRHARRHEVRPGITGYAQVNGRNTISWEQKFEYDVWYVDNISFWLDIKILALTIKNVFTRHGINASKYVTMDPFLGEKNNE